MRIDAILNCSQRYVESSLNSIDLFQILFSDGHIQSFFVLSEVSRPDRLSLEQALSMDVVLNLDYKKI